MGRRRSVGAGAPQGARQSSSLSFPALAAALCALGLTACQDTAPATAPSGAARAPSLAAAPNVPASDVIPDEYIVTFKGDVQDAPGLAKQLAAQHGATVRFTYTAAIKGFAAHMSVQAAAALEKNPQVMRVEQDRVAHTTATQTNPPSWGLDRIDQRTLPLSSSYMSASDGTGVNVYVIDTGIRTTHQDFGGRAVGAYTAILDGNGTNDCDGHGTHVAGTVGGLTYGVAKAVKLYAVRVAGCTGSGAISGLISGIDWVTKNRLLPAVANMSIEAGLSSTLNAAVEALVNSGVSTVVAAGNDGGDACNYSPGSAPNALTVGASASFDAMSLFSNSGTCVDMFAPGQNIVSTSYASDTGSALKSGTSMAAPHAAGVIALFLSANPTASPTSVASALVGAATPNALSGIPAGTKNLLLYADLPPLGSSSAPPTDTATTPATPVASSDTPPVAKFTVSSCARGRCTFDGSASTDDRGIVSYSWSYGDGSSSTASSGLAKVSHTYLTAGTFSVTLTVRDTAGQVTSVTVVITLKKV